MDYKKLRDMVSHRVTFEYDSGSKVVGYVASCLPPSGAVQMLVLSKVAVFDGSKNVIARYDELPLVPNNLVGLRSPKVLSETSMILRLGLLTLAFAACAGPNHEIVEDRFDLAETSSSPEVTEVVDVGGGDVVMSGNLGMQNPDGVAVIGETLWIRGRAFGRQPAVTVGGRPAAVLARTRDGGIVVRVPPATPSGSQPVVVSNEVGRGERPIAVRRYAAVLAPGSGEIGWADVGAEGPIAAGATAVRGARWLALSSDGRAAYLAEASRSTVQVVEMPAPGGPKVVYRLDLGNDPIVALAAAGRAPMLAVVREKDVMLLDTSSPLRPARSTPRALPPEIVQAHVVAADLSPDGKLLAVATADGNRVALLDLVPRGRAAVAGELAIVPGRS